MTKKRRQCDILSCPLCEFVTKRRTAFARHVEEKHSMIVQDLWDELNGGPTLCACGCGKKTKFYNYVKGYATFLNGHALFKRSMGENAEKIIEKRRKTLRKNIEIGTVVNWAKGLTKETDERIRERAKKSKEKIREMYENGHQHWAKGLTRDDDERIKERAKKLKEKYASGETIPWSKGKTERDDERLKKKNDRQRERYKSGELIPWSKGLTKETDERVAGIWKKRDPMIEYDHIRLNNTDIIKRLEKNRQIRLETIEDYKNNMTPSLIVRCTICDWSRKVSLLFAQNDKCPKCFPSGSLLQIKIAKWIESLGFNVMVNVRGIIGRQELDIYVPEKKFAIEVNGLFWHNEQSGKGKDYHEIKTDLATMYGIKLIHVFEDEWNEKNDAVKSMIMSSLGVITSKIDSSECSMREITLDECLTFFEKNCVEEVVIGNECYVLIDENERIVSAISLNVHSKNDRLEILGMCHLLNHEVIGGSQKLINSVVEHARKNGFSGVSVKIDKRFGEGSEYESIGFKLKMTTSPKFWWTDKKKRFDQSTYREDELPNDSSIVKIWGCSSFIYTLDF